jgi:hypothetical protein
MALRCAIFDGECKERKRRRGNSPAAWKGGREAGRGDRRRACGCAPAAAELRSLRVSRGREGCGRCRGSGAPFIGWRRKGKGRGGGGVGARPSDH